LLQWFERALEIHKQYNSNIMIRNAAVADAIVPFLSAVRKMKAAKT
jgi:hypothetical protein